MFQQQGNRIELLLFYLGSKRRFAINVLKVQEVIPSPTLHHLPDANPDVLGVYTLRGETIPIIYLAKAIKATNRALSLDVMNKGTIITTEVNRRIQGMWIPSVDKIVTIDWEDIGPVDLNKHFSTYSTGITLIEDEMIQVLDVEKVLGEVLGFEASADDISIQQSTLEAIKDKRILIVDDSRLAIKQTVSAIEKMGLQYLTASNGKEGLKILDESYQAGFPIDMVISDIEMPEMDGYTFVREVRKSAHFSELHILMHTSLNGDINTQKAIACGANDILTKFVPEELADKVIAQLS